ncbi:MAG TPA: translation initiation factor IF-2, partial [bacterium]
MSKKLRVFQIARELSLSNEAVIEFLVKKDKSIRSQMSSVSEDLYDEICKRFKKTEAAPVDSGQDFRQKLKEKQMLEDLRRKKKQQELEERIKFATQLAEERPKKLKKAKEEREEKKTKKVRPRDVEAIKAESDVSATEEPSVVEMISKAKKEIDKQKQAETVEKEKTKKKRGEEEKVVVEQAVEPELEKKKTRPGKKETAEPAVEKAVPSLRAAEVEAKGRKEEPAAAPAVAAKPETVEEGAKKKGKKKKKRKISEEEIAESIRQTLAAMDEVKPKRRKRKAKEETEAEVEDDKEVIKVSEFISAAELADLLGVEATQVIKKCFELGMMVSINQRLDMDTIVAVADEFGFDVEIVAEYGTEIISQEEEDEETDLQSRPPVVTIMGHVDHGKTSLLDYIRKSNIIAGEAGGITQHIGAYEVNVNGRSITFLDTPGHEAFTAMRARGAQVTDLVILIVAADDGVQPQTIEAINHAKAAGVPIVVAINKIDKPGANPDFVKKQLAENNILVEGWGGKYQSVEVSAKSGAGMERLLEMILLEADILELKANAKRPARGIIIESKLDKGKGPVATMLVQHGTLQVGNLFISGQYAGKVRAMYNERNQKVSDAGPATPVQVVGFEGVPQAGDTFIVMESEREVREISAKRQQLKREQDFRRRRHVTLDQISQRIRHGEVKELNIILKADVDGSIEALGDALLRLSNEEVAVNVIHKAVGGISESDVLLASASEAIIIGFQVRPTLQARDLAKKEDIDIRIYRVIYDAVEDVKSALEGLLEPEISEEITSTVEVRNTFKVPKIGTVAGCYVLSGKVIRNDLAKIYREDKLLNESRIGSLKRFKEDVREVTS